MGNVACCDDTGSKVRIQKCISAAQEAADAANRAHSEAVLKAIEAEEALQELPAADRSSDEAAAGDSAAGASVDPYVKGSGLEGLEKEDVKAHFRELVTKFARTAVRGCPCTYFRRGECRRFPAHYQVDAPLETLRILLQHPPKKGPGISGVPPVSEGSYVELVCPIASVRDIYSLAEDAASLFPPETVAALAEDECELLLMVVYSDSRGKRARFCFVESSRESRDSFLEALRVLCWNTQMPSGYQASITR